MTKIAICGKGGSGKSTISALLAKALEKKGYRVLIVDVDESNYGLHCHLGMDQPTELINYLGGKEQATKSIQKYYDTGDSKAIFDNAWTIGDIPGEYVTKKGGITLLAMGKIDHFGEGCACTIGTLAKLFFNNLSLGEKDIVIADTEAGIEHLGRGIEAGFDVILVIIDPSYESIRLCKKIKEMASGNDTETYFVLNKVDSGIVDDMLKVLDIKDVAASVPADQGLFKASLYGKELDLNVAEVDKLAFFVEQRVNS